MKKRKTVRRLAVLLLSALLLCACAPETPSAPSESVSTPESVSVPESASAPESVSAPESASVPESVSAPESASVPESASENDASEAQALNTLWARTEGKWLIEEQETAGGFASPVFEFCAGRTEKGGRTLRQYSAYGSGAQEWVFESAEEENGVYTLTAVEERNEMNAFDCRAGGGSRFTLQWDGEALLVRWERPAAAWREGTPYTVRPATAEEQQKLAGLDEGEGRLTLEDGTILVVGYEEGPSRYKSVTDEQLESFVRNGG